MTSENNKGLGVWHRAMASDKKRNLYTYTPDAKLYKITLKNDYS